MRPRFEILVIQACTQTIVQSRWSSLIGFTTGVNCRLDVLVSPVLLLRSLFLEVSAMSKVSSVASDVFFTSVAAAKDVLGGCLVDEFVMLGDFVPNGFIKRH